MTICERMFAIIDSNESKSAAGLSKALGVGTSQTTNWKQRNSDPPARMIYKICEYLEVSVEYLLTGKDTCVYTNVCNQNLSELEELLLRYFRECDIEKRISIIGFSKQQAAQAAEQGMA